MKLLHALTLLSASACVMVLGLSYAEAQPEVPPPARTPNQPIPMRDAPATEVRELADDGASNGSPQGRGGAQRTESGSPSRGFVPSEGRGLHQHPRRNAQEPAEGEEPAALPQFETGTEYRAMSPRTRVTFNLEDADLPDLVRLVSTITGKRFILPGKARSIKATVFAPTKVTVAEAYNAFLSILEVNGMTVVPAGRYLKIQETTSIENQPIPLYTGGGVTPAAERYVTRMHRVQNLSAEDASSLLDRFKSSTGTIVAYAPTNTLIITDTGIQIRRMLRLLEALDVPRTGEQIWIEPVHYADATELASRLQEIFPSAAAGAAAAPTPAARPTPPRRRRAAATTTDNAANAGGAAAATVGSRRGESRISNILADERTNSLIIMATERAYLRILEMLRHLDVPLEGEGRIHVHYVQNGDAAEIESTLSSLIGGGGGSRAAASKTGGATARARPAAAAGGAGLPDLFEGDIRVTTHAPTNALVITSSLHDYAALRRVIERLDRPRRQVFIEAVVMELQIDRSRSLGLSFHAGVPDAAGDDSLSILGFNAGNSIGFPASQDALTGLAVGVRGPEIEGALQQVGVSIPGFGVVLNAMANSGDANVLSTPHIIAMDNVQAEINVGQNVPLQTSGIAGGIGGLGGLAGLAGGAQGGAGGLGALAGLAGGLGGGGFGGVQRQDVGTIIRVTPHINEHDEIRLEIEEEISEVGAAQGDLGVVPINRRTAKTEVMVRDQQTVVIGGLMRESVTRSESKVPILGDIPLLGALFRNTTQTRQKNNLLLFLTPYIIRDMRDLRAIYERKMRERQEFLDRYFVFGDHDYEPPVDYSRTRGLVAEIINELEELAQEEELNAALAAEPPPEHVPREPVGIFEVDTAGGDVIIGPQGEEEPPETQQVPVVSVPITPNIGEATTTLDPQQP